MSETTLAAPPGRVLLHFDLQSGNLAFYRKQHLHWYLEHLVQKLTGFIIEEINDWICAFVYTSSQS